MANKLTLNLKSDKFSDFVNKLQDLTNISDTIKLKIDNDNILAYSMLSNDVAVLALKNYLLPTSDYIKKFDSEFSFDYIITSAGKFVKNLKFFNSELPIELEMIYKPSTDNEDIMHVRSAKYSNGKLKISCIGGELSKIRDINKTALESRLDIKKSKWGFKISKADFQDVKKLSSINSEDRILNVIVEKGKVSMMEEYKWELEVDKVDDDKNTKIIFNKKYMSNINDENDIIDFKIFETFILVKDDNSNLMLSFETDFTTEE
jgi:hypothetical protein